MNNYISGAVCRGEIHYVNNPNSEGSETMNARSAVVVSNNSCNEYSSVIEVVYLTTAQKKSMPTHVYLKDTSNGEGSGSTALCEAVYSISKKRLQENSYVARVLDKDMERIDRALMISLGLDEYAGSKPKAVQCIEEPEPAEPETPSESTYEEDMETRDKIRDLEFQVDFYRRKYEETIERIMTKAKL